MFVSIMASAQVQVVIWTNQNLHGTIKVYYNNRYAGTITKYYSSAPGPGAAGCVTLTISGNGNTFYGEAQDGTRWYSEKMTLHSGNYYTIRLYSSGATSSQNNRTTSYNRTGGSSSGYGSGYSNSNESAASRIGGQIGSGIANTLGSAAMHASTISMEGYPNLQVQMGYSSMAGEFVGVGTDLGGLGGGYFQGAIYKNLLAKDKTKGLDAWALKVGFYGGNEKNTFRFNISLPYIYRLPKKMAVGIDLEYARYFTSRLGVLGGVGFHGYDKENHKSGFLFDANICLVYKILSN